MKRAALYLQVAADEPVADKLDALRGRAERAGLEVVAEAVDVGEARGGRQELDRMLADGAVDQIVE